MKCFDPPLSSLLVDGTHIKTLIVGEYDSHLICRQISKCLETKRMIELRSRRLVLYLIGESLVGFIVQIHYTKHAFRQVRGPSYLQVFCNS